VFLWHWWHDRLSKLHFKKEPIAQKPFKPKFPEIPVQKDYRSIDQAGWDAFPVNEARVGTSNLKGGAVKKIADALGCQDKERLVTVLDRIKNGADIGCRGEFRSPSVYKNSRDSYKVGRQVTDAVASWVKEGYVRGPVEEEDVPAEAKINGILTRQKPNGSVRVILNLSAPKGRSVNDGINNEEFPATMSSTAAWLRVLNKAGKGCWITKVDWSDAYKHISVREEDLNLQWFEWGGKFFQELSLVFGCASSAGIYDAAAKTIIDLVCRRAQFSPKMVCQHLDDVVAAAPQDSKQLEEFVKAYQEIAAATGVKLAPTDDPEKAFLPGKEGIVFGVHYNTEDWTWRIPGNKLAAINNSILEACETRKIRPKEAQSLIGKLVHIKPLVPTGKFNFFHIMRLSAEANSKEGSQQPLQLSEDCCRQLWLWLTLIKACQVNITIPSWPDSLPVWALQAYTDAAGGSLEGLGRGTGGTIGEIWFWVPWSKQVNAGGWKIEEVKVGRKLAALELIGPLAAVVASRKVAKGRAMRIWVDNSGSVAIWKKGYSTSCPLSSALVTAIAACAAAWNIKVEIEKITRCSCPEAEMADALSKADFQRFRNTAREAGLEMHQEPARLPAQLIAWIDKPTADFNLADRILKEVAEQEEILGYNQEYVFHK